MQQRSKSIISYLSVILAAVLLSFGYQLFIVPNDFAPAGLNGIATMIQYKTGFSIGYMSLLINIPLCILAWFFIDKGFAGKSLCFCLTYSFAFLLLQNVGLTAFQYDAQGHDTIFPVIISGLLSGVVYGLCFRNNASTGGTDIVSKYISTRKPALNFFWVTFILNAVVAAISFFVYAKPGTEGLVYDYKPVCLCILYCFLSSFVGNTIIKGAQSAVRFTIIADHPEQLAEELTRKLKHSCTLIRAEGTYTHQEKAVLICVVNKHQIADLRAILRNYEGTFAFSETVNETYGNFKLIRTPTEVK